MSERRDDEIWKVISDAPNCESCWGPSVGTCDDCKKSSIDSINRLITQEVIRELEELQESICHPMIEDRIDQLKKEIGE